MSPSWYDVLDVEPTATTTEIRAAWKSGIAELEPGHRRFRLLNQAAEVLLDPTSRAAYDAELAAVRESKPVAADVLDQPDKPAEPDEQVAAPVSASTRVGSRLPAWPLLALAAATAIVVVTTALLWLRLGDEVATPWSDPEAASSEQTSQAQSAAEQAIVPVLSYDYRTLEEDAAAARSYMTTDYRKKYDQLFAVLLENAPAARAVQETEVVASGIVRTGEDRVDVLVYVNRPLSNKVNPEPRISSDWATLRMLRVDGEWLVDDLVTQQLPA